MQIYKIAFVIGVCAVAASGVRATDNADQAAARAALVSKLFEIGDQSAPTNSVKSAPYTPPAAAPAFSTTTVVKPAVKVEDAVMRPVNPAPPSSPDYVPMSSRMDNGRNFRAVQTPHDQIQNPPMNWTKPAVVTAPTGKMTTPAPPKTQAPVTPPVVKSTSEFAPMVAPALPIGESKQQKLQELLAKYKADQITPEEYHRQRAAIINGM